MSSKKKLQEIASKKDFDIIKDSMNVHYNDDANVSLYAEALKNRVAAFNWKIKNNYYLFGMRKGIPEIIAKNLKEEYLTGKQMLKTVLDKDQMDGLFNKMIGKFNNTEGVSRTQTLDFTTGKIKDMRESVIMIGLPYEMRRKEDIKEFIEFIWDLENNTLIKIKKDDKLIDDTNSPKEQRGEIYKILTKQTDSPQVVMDTGSRSLQNHMNAVESIMSGSEI